MLTKAFIAFVACLSVGLVARGEIKSEIVEYKDGDTTLKGLVAWDDAITGKRPGVVVVHEWYGLNDYAKSRAEQLAKLGYVAFAADIYGDGFVTDDPKVAGPKSTEAKTAPGLLRRRGLLAVEALKKNDKVDASRTAAIGYCFGGTTALEIARGGGDVVGVVSFHGALKTDQPAQQGQIKAKILVCHGDADPFVPPAEVAAFEQEMKTAKASYEIKRYPGAVHSFTNPNAAKPGLPPEAVAYDKAADEQSWKDMQSFFKEIFGPPAAKQGG